MELIIFDDEEIFINKCCRCVEYFNKTTHFTNEKIHIVLATDNIDKVINLCEFSDLPFAILVDIMINEQKDGFKLVEKIESMNKEHVIIFITNYPELIIRNLKFKFSSLNFIIKENDKLFLTELYNTFLKADEIMETSNVFKFYRKDSGNIRILFKNIYYFEKEIYSNKINIFFKDGNKNGKSSFYDNLSNIVDKLDSRFLYCHRSFIVNTDMIDSVKRNYYIMKNGDKCPYIRKRIKEAKHNL